MPKRDTSALLQRTRSTGIKMSDRDRQVDSRRAEERGELNTALLDSIRNRDIDTRPLTMSHVWTLVDSIAVLGLIEPLVVDQKKVLLAGGHRLAAIKLLREEYKYAEAYAEHFPDDMIPVRIMPFVAASEPERALQVEVAENEHRRDYTPAEVRGIADHLREAGYEDVKGRPRKNQKPLMPALSVVVGKNLRTVQRYLHEEPKKEKSKTDVRYCLEKASKSLKKWQTSKPKTSAEKALAEKLPEILDLLAQAISDDTN